MLIIQLTSTVQKVETQTKKVEKNKKRKIMIKNKTGMPSIFLNTTEQSF